jgi:site-specific DNA-methyltransferase (adenine-specific)
MIDKFFVENCLDTMKCMPDDFVDLVVTSPPYDNLRTYNGYSFDFDAVVQGLFRVLKPGGVIVWIVGDATVKGSETGTSFRQALLFIEAGFNLHDTMIYAKNNPIPLTHNRYEQQFEYMFIFSKGKPKTFSPKLKLNKNVGGSIGKFYQKASDKDTSKANTDKPIKKVSIENNIWFYSVGRNKYKHPAPFPEQLAIDHVLSWSVEGDVVYDPFMGSGTTAKAALMCGRHFVGSEISQDYVDIAEKRLSEFRTSK